MYKGFPVGYLQFWETGADPAARQIGVDTRAAVPNHLIVDGQQRLTSLFAVMTGAKVLRDDYSQARIRIAFRPADAMFAVTDAAIEKDPEFIPDISTLWQPGGKKATTRAYLKAVASRRKVDAAEEERLEDAIDRLYDLQYYPFKVVELSSEADEEQVAEIFVRISRSIRPAILAPRSRSPRGSGSVTSRPRTMSRITNARMVRLSSRDLIAVSSTGSSPARSSSSPRAT